MKKYIKTLVKYFEDIIHKNLNKPSHFNSINGFTIAEIIKSEKFFRKWSGFIEDAFVLKLGHEYWNLFLAELETLGITIPKNCKSFRYLGIEVEKDLTVNPYKIRFK